MVLRRLALFRSPFRKIFESTSSETATQTSACLAMMSLSCLTVPSSLERCNSLESKFRDPPQFQMTRASTLLVNSQSETPLDAPFPLIAIRSTTLAFPKLPSQADLGLDAVLRISIHRLATGGYCFEATFFLKCAQLFLWRYLARCQRRSPCQKISSLTL